ncbi:MAG: hypothetical protein HQM14_03040 [SAR324 cluster bacterium]|nr:hypothetical protein [SAR324 cluster bacterium]
MTPTPLEIIRKILTEQCECEGNIAEHTHLVKDLELESIYLLTLLTELENHYQMVFEITEDSNIHTVGDIVDYIKTNVIAHE